MYNQILFQLLNFLLRNKNLENIFCFYHYRYNQKISVSLDKRIYDLLEQVSEEKDINKSKLVEKLIRDYLKEEKGIDTSKII